MSKKFQKVDYPIDEENVDRS